MTPVRHGESEPGTVVSVVEIRDTIGLGTGMLNIQVN